LPAVTPERAYLAEVTRRVRRSLGEAAAGVWLFGSAALGDYAARRSDLDIQAVSTMRLERPVLTELAAALDQEVLPCPARKLEFVLYAADDLRDPAGPAFQLNLNTGAGVGRHVALDPGDDPRFWFVIDVAIGRQHGVALAGPPPASVLPELPRRLVVDSLAAALDWYESGGESPTQTILAASRTWAWAADGRWRSKEESARWAGERLEDPGPVRAALRARDDASASPPAPDAAASLVRRARAALRALG
jgi:hypothetical protein